MDTEAAKTDDLRPLLLFFDCEAARGNVFRDDIIEIAVKCQPDLHPTAEFDSLIHTSQRICSFGQENGLTARALKGQPKFPEVLDRLLVWCDDVVEQVNLRTNYKHYPVLVAHGGELFDFLMLFSHCERHGIPVDRLREHNLHFADTFIHLDEVKKSGHELLDGCPLSLDFLLNEWFPGEFSEGRHRAMVDVQLLIKIFYETPLHQFLSTLPIFSTEEWKVFYETKKEIRKDKREFGDKLWFLHEVHRKFVIRSLVRHGLNYEGLKDFYQQCRSVQHFKQEMRELMDTHVKSFSIKRIAEHFSSENLPQLGTIPYRPPTSTNKYQPACYHETDATGTHFRLRYGRKSSVRPSLPSQQTQEESPPEAEEAGPDSSSYPVGTSVSRGVPPTSGGGSLSPSAGGSVSRGFSPAARGRGRARALGTRPCDAGWMYNPLHKQVPADFGNHDDGWLSDGDSASYSPDDVTPVNVQKTQVTTTLVPREGRSTIFDNDEGDTDHRNTGMSFSKIKKELEKSTASVRGRGVRRRHAFVDRSQAEEGRRFEGRCKDSNQGRRNSFEEKTFEKVDKRSDGSGAEKVERCRHAFQDRSQNEEGRRSEARCKEDSHQGKSRSFREKTFEKVDKRTDGSGAKKVERRRHAFLDRSQAEERRRSEARFKDSNQGRSHSFHEKTFEKVDKRSDGSGADFCQSHPKKVDQRRHAFEDRSQAEEGRRFEGRFKEDSYQGRCRSLEEKTSEKVDKRSDGSGAYFCQSHPKNVEQRRHAFEDRGQADAVRRFEARCKDSYQGKSHSFEEKTFEKVDKRSDGSRANFKEVEQRRHAFEDRSQAEEGRKSEVRCKDSHQGRRHSFEEKTSEKVDKKNEARSRPGQKYTTSTSQHERKRSPEDKGERSSTWPPVFTYAQVLTEGKSRREVDGKGVTKSAPKDSTGKESKTKSVHKAQRADRQYRSEHDIRNGTEEQAVGFNTSEDNRKEDFCTPHPNEAEHSGNRKSAPKDSTGKESKTKSVHKTQKADRQYRSEHDIRNGTEEQAVGFNTSEDNRKEDFCTPHPNEAEHSGNRKSAPKDSTGKESKTKSVHKTQKPVRQYKSEHDTRYGTEEQAVGFKTKDNRKEDFCKSHLNEVERQHAGNRRRQNQWPDLFKQRQKRENQRHQNERKDLRDSEESIAKGPPSSLEEKCRCGLQEKLPRSNFRKQNTNQRPRKPKNFAEKKCFCGLPHVEEDIQKSKKTSQVVSSGKISEDSTRGHLRSRPSSAKYGVLSTQDGRKKRDGPKDERKKTDKPKKDTEEEEGLDVSIEELLPFKNDAYKYLFTPVTDMDSSTAEEYDKLIVMYNQEYFQQKEGD
ncbi:uncharacterized protein LOC144904534 [Branchiostoma floridae x Branchiostoma belcheri]